LTSGKDFSGSISECLKGERFMKSLAKILTVVALAMGMTAAANPAPTGGGAEAFEKLKALVGHWEEQQPSAMKQKLDIQLTSGGSVVLERSSMVQDGTPVEMITMYYLDGDQVKLTHYCEARNQPTMRGTYAPETKTLTFDFVSATNMKSPDDGHMHHAIYTFVDNDHLRQVWTFRTNQKDAFTEDTTFVRK
jgi:hypothetical protein